MTTITIPVFGATTRVQEMCRSLPYGQRVFLIEYKVNGEKKREQLNENFFINGNKAGIGSRIVLDTTQETLHPSIYSSLREHGVQTDGETTYEVVDVGLLIETNPHKVVFRCEEIADFIKMEKP